MNISDHVPVNIGILKPTPLNTGNLRPTSSLNDMEGSSQNFNDDGLFSIRTFGPVGSEERDKRFSVIDVRVEIIHPYLYKTLISLRGFYQDIMHGRAYAVWNDEISDFEKSDILNGDTGYQFFIERLPIIKFKQSESEERARKITVIEDAIKNNELTTTRIMVMPAGYRDMEFDRDGKVSEHEVNDFYRSFIATANSIVGSSDLTNPIFNVPRNSIQRTFNTLFQYLFEMLDGKTGFIQSKWARRGIVNGTRNVITSLPSVVTRLGDPTSMTMVHTAVGLYQTLKGTLPVSIHYILNGWIGQIFENGTHARLVNKKTLESELIPLDYDTYDLWTTETGITKLIDKYEDLGIRLSPATVLDHYVGLIYLGDDATFKIFGDIRELPKGFDRSKVRPLTYCELFYISGYREWKDIPVVDTRFPFNQMESLVPTRPYVMTTVKSELRYPLDESWQKISDDEYAATCYPVIDGTDAHFDTASPHFAMLAGFGGDYDGDKMSFNYAYSEESRQELNRLIDDPVHYLSSRGKLSMSSMIDTTILVLHNLTRDF